jgi:class 3 adenylate cyclase/DNA-binding CsgD family transcriptional regulator/tetratricopeptide (TPR) repeat protein
VEPVERERGQALVTILFTDLVASTEALDRLGDEAAETMRRDHFRLVREAVGERGGTTVKSLGDGLMVVFGSAIEAVTAAQAIQQRVTVENTRSDGIPTRVRIGLHVGEPIRDEGDYFGRPVVLARRLCDAAGPGVIVASDLVRDLVGTRGGVVFEAVGRRALKGFSEPVRMFKILWDDVPAAPTAPANRDLDPRGVDLVGRDAQLAVLERELALATQGELRAVLLVGEGGVGKTRLITELCRRHESEVAVLSARAYPLGATASMGLWIEAADRYLRALGPSEVEAVCGTARGDLAALLPSVATIPSTAATQPPPLVRQLNAMAQLLANIARTTPVIVTLDDVHLADGSSWEALGYLARNLIGSRVLLLFAARPVELAAHEVGSEVLLGLEQDGMLRPMTVEPLDRAAIRQLSETFLDAEVDERLVEWLAHRSQGSPLFAVGLLRALLDEGADLADPALTSLPEDLAGRVAARLKSLDAPTRSTLELIAVLGFQADLADLERMSDRDLDALSDALHELVRLRLVAEDERGREIRYEIAHPLYQEAIYAGIGAPRRRAVHRHIARSLVESGRYGAAAPHFVRSAAPGDDEAIDALREALRHAEALEHHRESIELLAALLELLPEGDRRWLEVFDAMSWQSDWVVEHRADNGVDVAVRAMRTIEQLAEAAPDLVRRGAAKSHLASFVAWGIGDTGVGLRLANDARRLFADAGEEARELLAANEIGYLRGIEGDLEEHERIATDVLARAQMIGDRRAELQAICSLNFALQFSGRLHEALASVEDGLQIAREDASAYRVTYLLAQWGFVAALLGRLDDARSSLAAGVAANPAYLDTMLPDFAANVHWLAGDLVDAAGWVRQSVGASGSRLSQRRMHGASIATIATAEIGDAGQLERWFDVLTRFDRRDWWWHSDLVPWATGVACALRGESDHAVELLLRATRRMVDTRSSIFAWLALADLAETALDAGDDGAAVEVARRLDALGPPQGAPLTAVAELARAAATVGRAPDDAVERLTASAAAFEQAGWKLFHGRALALAARALARANRDDAVECLRDAALAFESCGATVRRDRALELLDRLGPRGRRARTSLSGPGALSARERDVVQLAVEGLSAREIGERLFIGRRTVETHLTNVYAKLGINSRVELVRRASELADLEPTATPVP